MKTFFTLLTICGLCLPVYANGTLKTHVREIGEVNTAQFATENGSTTLEIIYSTGGCDPKFNNPQISLKLVSIKDVTPGWALESNPNEIHEYQVVMKAIVTETRTNPTCAASYQLKTSANLSDLFKQDASKYGIDLSAKKAHYGVIFQAPSVAGSSFFSAFSNK